MSPREGPSRPKFGRIDPYCLMAVLPVLLVAGILGALVNVALGLGCAVFAGLILLFDSWANRPARAPREPEPEAPARAPRPAQGRPPRPADRGPGRRPGPPPPRQQQGQRPVRQAPRGAPYR